MSRPIGGYFALDEGGEQTPLPNGVLLNSARNALRHIVRQLNICSIHLPCYICPVVADALSEENVQIHRYQLTEDFLPTQHFATDDFILYVNYFGVSGKRVEALAQRYPNLIVDCAQAYFAKPKGRASFSSPRKFFGVPDGGVAFQVPDVAYDVDDSSSRMGHLIERKVNGPTPKGYTLFQSSEASLEHAPIFQMSHLTQSLLNKVNSKEAIKVRMANFNFLHERLNSTFPFALADDDVPMVYPYLTENSGLRQRLIDNKIFVARYWPNVEEANQFSDRIVPLPIDQRYGLEDMDRICEVIFK